MNNNIPTNLMSIHRMEEELRNQAHSFIQSNDDLASHLSIAESSMDVIDVYVRGQLEASNEGRVLQHLAIRVFNDLASAWKLSASGYFQTAAMVQRDIIETLNLVHHFSNHHDQIDVWFYASDGDRQKLFKPHKIREALESHEGLPNPARADLYKKYCVLAAHPTPEGFAMLKPGGRDAIIGPFMEPLMLRALLEEQGKLAIQAGMLFAIFLNTDSAVSAGVLDAFFTNAIAYSPKYLSHLYTPEAIDKLVECFVELRSMLKI